MHDKSILTFYTAEQHLFRSMCNVLCACVFWTKCKRDLYKPEGKLKRTHPNTPKHIPIHSLCCMYTYARVHVAWSRSRTLCVHIATAARKTKMKNRTHTKKHAWNECLVKVVLLFHVFNIMNLSKVQTHTQSRAEHEQKPNHALSLPLRACKCQIVVICAFEERFMCFFLFEFIFNINRHFNYTYLMYPERKQKSMELKLFDSNYDFSVTLQSVALYRSIASN